MSQQPDSPVNSGPSNTTRAPRSRPTPTANTATSTDINEDGILGPRDSSADLPTLPDVLSRVWTNCEARPEHQDEDLSQGHHHQCPSLLGPKTGRILTVSQNPARAGRKNLGLQFISPPHNNLTRSFNSKQQEQVCTIVISNLMRCPNTRSKPKHSWT